jgi:hypothetical protein
VYGHIHHGIHSTDDEAKLAAEQRKGPRPTRMTGARICLVRSKSATSPQKHRNAPRLPNANGLRLCS